MAPSLLEAIFNYNYRLCSPDGSQVSDWGNDRAVNPASFHKEEVTIIDSWNEAGFYENAFYTEPFQGILLKPDQTEARGPSPARVTR
jgi:4-alpha-glucanotransferase